MDVHPTKNVSIGIDPYPFQPGASWIVCKHDDYQWLEWGTLWYANNVLGSLKKDIGE
jgi:hypothetical protein